MADMTDKTALHSEQSGAVPRPGVALSALLEDAETIRQVRKHELHDGDWLAVKTANSIYTIRVMGNGEYLIAGGWFDAHGYSSSRVRINGCTWGGSVIKVDVVAACGLHLEFSNRVRTSAIKTIVFMPGARLN